VPAGAVFTDTVTTINGKTGAITKADIVALGIPAQDTNTTYAEITTAEIDAGTSSTLRTITARRLKYLLDKIVALFPTKTSELTNDSGFLTSVTKSDVGLGNVDNVKQATKAEFDAHKADGASHSKTARFVIGTSTAGWTAADCDYLCDGTADQTEINAAITALPATGGEIVILDGTYNITAKIDVTKDNVSIRGNGNATILKRMFDSISGEGVITLTSRSGCNVANLQIDGNSTSFSNVSNAGISLDSSSNNTIIGNTCNNGIYGIRIIDSSKNTITGNTCSSNDFGILLLLASSNNIVTGNTCTRGTGLPTDYTTMQNTIWLVGTDNNYNLISNNNCMGKAPMVDGGTGNTVINNKWNATSDFEDLRTDVGDKSTLITTDKTNLVNAVNETKAQINDLDANKVDNSRVLTDVPLNAKFTDTTYSVISTAEIDSGTASTSRVINAQRLKYISDKLKITIGTTQPTSGWWFKEI
jgi:parallel beta-helix repeat protein